MRHGFLFDIDGCLTLANLDYSELDTDLLKKIGELANDYPVAFVTGRSEGWLKKQYRKIGVDYWNIPTYMEFGLVCRTGDKLVFNNDGESFLAIRTQIIQDLAKVCNDEDVYLEPQIMYDDYPDHGSLWVENKFVMLSIAANSQVTVPQVHQLTGRAVNGRNDIRLLNHHLGVDILPAGWSKMEATRDFIQGLNEEEYQWHVFGDNVSDQEMTHGLSRHSFVNTKEGASTDVTAYLESMEY